MTTKPVLLAEDDEPTVLQAIEHDLRREYGCAGYVRRVTHDEIADAVG